MTALLKADDRVLFAGAHIQDGIARLRYSHHSAAQLARCRIYNIEGCDIRAGTFSLRTVCRGVTSARGRFRFVPRRYRRAARTAAELRALNTTQRKSSTLSTTRLPVRVQSTTWSGCGTEHDIDGSNTAMFDE